MERTTGTHYDSTTRIHRFLSEVDDTRDVMVENINRIVANMESAQGLGGEVGMQPNRDRRPSNWPAARVGLVVFSIITALGACVAAYILLAHFGPASFVKHLPLQQIAGSSTALYCLPLVALPVAGTVGTGLVWSARKPFQSSLPTPEPTVRNIPRQGETRVLVVQEVKVRLGENDPGPDFGRFLGNNYKPPRKAAFVECTAARHVPVAGQRYAFERVMGEHLSDEELLNIRCDDFRFDVPRISHDLFTYRRPQNAEEGEVHCFPDFGNRHFGGGALNLGFAQEEILFLQCPELYQTLYAMRGYTNLLSLQDEHGVPNPIIFRDIRIKYDIHGIYGTREMFKLGGVRQHITPIAQHNQSPVTLFDFAAVDYRKISAQTYTEESLVYHLKAAYLAFDGIKRGLEEGHRAVIHMSDWGCGVFKGSPYVMVPLLMLAAKMADVEIVFEGVKGEGALYSKACINDSLALLNGVFSEQSVTQNNPKKVIDRLLETGDHDPRYRPYPKWA